MKFIAASLEDIAAHFDRSANAARAKLEARPTGRKLTHDAVALGAEVDTWTAAAAILRETELTTGKRRRKAAS